MSRARRILSPLAEFLQTESAGAVVLALATVVALVWANVASGSYVDFWDREIFGDDLQAWVNDGLMTLFFFVVGLEIKRELVLGELRDPRAALVPALAAVGGMVVPAAIYLAITAGTGHSDGWGIPIATDIAFAVGALALLGSRVPSPLKLFLLALAIVDDIGAILVIAFFYGHDVEPVWLLGTVAALVVVVALRAARIPSPLAYVIPGVAAWYCLHESGVHPTIAGVALGLLTPATWPGRASPIDRLEHRLHPFSSFLVVPVFALANAGVEVGSGAIRDAFENRVTWGVIAGLVVGKFVGVAGATLLAVRFGLGRLSADLTRRHVLGAAALAGIGFTVSLFVAELSFGGGQGPLADAKIAILLGSAISGVIGGSVLWRAPATAANE